MENEHYETTILSALSHLPIKCHQMQDVSKAEDLKPHMPVVLSLLLLLPAGKQNFKSSMLTVANKAERERQKELEE